MPTVAPTAAAAPTLTASGPDRLHVEWIVPSGVAKAQAFAAVSLQADGTSRWMRVDAASGKLDEPDALPLPLASTSCEVKGVDPNVKYIARVRLGPDFDRIEPNEPQ